MRYSHADLPTNRFLVVCGGSGVNLLGQLSLLGFNAELQIDASSEVIVRGGQRSFALKLDEQIGAVAELLFQTRARVSDPPEKYSSVYLQQEISHPADVNHIKYLAEKWIGGGLLRDGMAAAPAIGGAAIKHPLNASALGSILTRMLGQFGVAPGPANPVEFWIVSSTAGGTGEGIHRYVGIMIADFIKKYYPLTPVSLNFIRIGPMTFRTIHPHRTVLNTLFGLAADAAMDRIFRFDFPNAVTNWFYTDLPDVGRGDIGKNVRAQLIEIAAKSILLDDLSFDLTKLLINNSGSHVVIAQTGFWGKDFNEDVKYYETLKQLTNKLEHLISPNLTDFLNANQPRVFFAENDWQEGWGEPIRRIVENPSHLEKKIDEGWGFPRVQEKDVYFTQRTSKMISDWKQSIRYLVDFDIDTLRGLLSIDRVISDGSGEERRAVVPFVLDIGAEEDLFSKIDDAHRAIAWCDELLGDGPASNHRAGLLNDLYECALVVSRVMNPSIIEAMNSNPRKKANALSTRLWPFLVALTKVNFLIQFRDEAKRILDALLIEPRKILAFTKNEQDFAGRSIEGTPASPVLAADLSARLDRVGDKSWLQLLYQSVNQGDRSSFRRHVLRGATGLTLTGLRAVLGTQPNADIAQIRNIIDESSGRMITPDGLDYEAQWWQANPPAGITMLYDYRILPALEPGLAEQLRSFERGGAGPTYVFTRLGVTGLYVLSFRAASLNKIPGPDTTSAYVYLMQPIVRILQDFIRQWAEDPKTGRSGQFEIAAAGVIGDPLDRQVLTKGGLTEYEIERISELYQLYDENRQPR